MEIKTFLMYNTQTMGSKENERLSPPEITLGQEIFPFKGKILKKDHTGRFECQAWRRLSILTDGGSNSVKVEFDLFEVTSDGLGVMPFHPEKGYIIDREDLDIETRKNKILRHVQKGIQKPIRVLILHTYITGDSLLREKIISINDDGKLTESGTVAFQQLEFTVGSFVARSEFSWRELHGPYDLFDFSDLYIFFGNFYPIDLGPLPTQDPMQSDTRTLVDEKILIGLGHSLAFQINENEIDKIGVKFDLAKRS